MTEKCKKGQKKVGGRCVNKKTHKIFGNLADEVDILKVALIGSLFAVSGWLVFSGILDIFGLSDINGWIKLIIGFVFIVALTKFGLKRK